MKTTLSIYDFRGGMQSIRPNSFTYAGLGTLFDILTELEESTEAELEFDPIAICCEFSEYTADELKEYYSETIADSGSFDEFLEDHNVYKVDSEETYIIQDF